MEKWKLTVAVLMLCLVAMVTTTESAESIVHTIQHPPLVPNTQPDMSSGKPYFPKPKKMYRVPESPSFMQKYIGHTDICEGMYVCDTPIHGKRSMTNCFPITSVCDGIVDCHNGIDEKNCEDKTKPDLGSICATEQYLCMDGRTCAKLCDGKWECPDGEDERLCSKWCTCPEGYYRCKGEDKCVPLACVCDGQTNCKYEDDECNCEQCQCGPEQFKCSDGKTCVDPENVCDAVENCPHGDDEKECPAACACAPTQFLCPNSNVCIESHELCECGEDGLGFGFLPIGHNCYDCPGREDESEELCDFT